MDIGQTLVGAAFMVGLVCVTILTGKGILETQTLYMANYEANMTAQAEQQCGNGSTWYFYPCQHEIKCAPDAWSEETKWAPNEIGYCGIV